MWLYIPAFLEGKELPPLLSLFNLLSMQQTAENSPGVVQPAAGFASRDRTFTSAYAEPKTRQK